MIYRTEQKHFKNNGKVNGSADFNETRK